MILPGVPKPGFFYALQAFFSGVEWGKSTLGYFPEKVVRIYICIFLLQIDGMMRKFFLLVFLNLVFLTLKSQNLQLHYDFGKGRHYLTSTVEMFKPDKYGNTFFFIDMNYGADGVKGVSLGYWEISRAIKFWENPFAFHVEYNGGAGVFRDGDFTGGYNIRDAWLAGFEYSWNSKDFSRGFTLQGLYKNIQGKNKYSFQVTGVWFLNFFNHRFTFDGYADFWREDKSFNGKATKFVVQSEPQIWFNINKNFAVGNETEIGYNFQYKGLKFMPTLGVKATF
jgi:hypothetical protein